MRVPSKVPGAPRWIGKPLYEQVTIAVLRPGEARAGVYSITVPVYRGQTYLDVINDNIESLHECVGTGAGKTVELLTVAGNNGEDMFTISPYESYNPSLQTTLAVREISV